MAQYRISKQFSNCYCLMDLKIERDLQEGDQTGEAIDEEENIKQSQDDILDSKQASKVTLSTIPLRFMSPLMFCMSRPQYKRSCGISSLVSIFNYQFSTLGMGKLPPLSMQEALIKLNLIGVGSLADSLKQKGAPSKCEQLGEETLNEKLPEKDNRSLREIVNDIDFGRFTGNGTLLRWYRVLCRLYGVTGRAYYFYKTAGCMKTNKTQNEVKDQLIEKLVESKTSFIYHAHDHYFCPVGYELLPQKPYREFQDQSSQIIKESELWVMVADPSRCFPIFHTFNWNEIQKDLTTYFPYTFNIRNKKQTTRSYKEKEAWKCGRTINCILAFEKIKD